MEPLVTVLVMLLAVVVSSFIARVTKMPVPLVQIALGAGLFCVRLAPVKLDPDVFFLLFLPPLLFLDGWRIPKDDLFQDATVILKLALGLVVFTVLGMGYFLHWLVPAMPLAVAFALAAVISPTDPIAVSAVAAQTSIPARLMHIIQGESLLNDASGLVSMRFAVAAAMTATFSLPDALGTFLWVALGGLAIGATMTWVVGRAKSWSAARYGENAGAEILVTLLLPFGAYLLAEEIHCSGILAAAAAGIAMTFTAMSQWHGATRLRGAAVLELLQFAANGSIFVLLGEQLPAIAAKATRTVRDTGHESAWWLVLYVAVVVLGLAVLRLAWVWASTRVAFVGARLRGEQATLVDWRIVTALSLTGVRGAVTLAGVLTLPLALGDGSPFPTRDLAIFLAAGVILASLVLASVALPGALRKLSLPTDRLDPATENQARKAAAEAALRAIEWQRRAVAEEVPAASVQFEAAERVAEFYRQRIARYSGEDWAATAGQRDEVEAQWRLAALRAEREEIRRAGRQQAIDSATMGKLLREIDLQEARYGG